MKRLILLVISSCAAFYSYAQEEIRFDSIPKIQNESELRMPVMEKPFIFENSYSNKDLHLFDKQIFNQPLLHDFAKNLDFKKYLNNTGLTIETSTISGIVFSPFFANNAIFNQASYRMNDRFTFGGNSFGAQSVFEAPKMNSNFQDMSIKGASMFLQYKVSDKFKIETRISISGHQSPGEP
jgi:hypothetical protein